MSIRLLYVTQEGFPNYRADLAVLFGKYLPRLGLYSDIVSNAETGNATSALPWEGGEPILCQTPTNRALYHLVKLSHTVISLLRCDAKQYAAIQVRDLSVAALFALIIARYKKLPFFYWLSFPQSEAQIYRATARSWRAGLRYFFPLLQGHIGKYLLYKLILPRAEHIFVQSVKMREDLQQLGVPFEKMTPVPMAVDLEAAQLDNITPMNDPRLIGKRVVIYIGTLDYARKIELLFEMLASVQQKQPDVVLVIAGSIEDSAHLAWLKTQAEQWGVSDAVIWTGWLPMSDAWRYARAAEVGLSPFPRSFLLDSATPTKAIEYMALGIPTLCNDNPDQAQLMKNSGAGVCVTLSAENFASALIDLLNNPEQRQQMAIAGRQYVAQFRSYEKLASEVFEVYQRLLT